MDESLSIPEPLENYPLEPYASWPEEPESRWVYAGHTFGIHLMKATRDQALKRIPADADEETRRVAAAAVHTAIFGMMELLDGFFRNEIDSEHRVDYVLQAHIRSRDGGPVQETVEIAPGGDGLAIGFHGWWKNEFFW